MELGERIKTIRERRLFLTQKELGARLGVDQVTISRWERGVREPRTRHLRELAELAEIPMKDFFPEEVAA